MIVLNVGYGGISCLGNSIYKGWQEVTLDVDEGCKPTILGDVLHDDVIGLVREMHCEAIYCSHTLEHYYAHEAPRVLRRFRDLAALRHGFVHIIVPDIEAVMRAVVCGVPLHGPLYESPNGPISAHDVLYGYGKWVERFGPAMQHKCGFIPATLNQAMWDAGFPYVYLAHQPEIYQVQAFGFVAEPTEEQRKLLGMK